MSAGTASPGRTSAETLTRGEPLTMGNVSALQAAQSGPSPRSPPSEMSVSSAYTWQDWGSLAASLPVMTTSSASRPVPQATAPTLPVRVPTPAPISAPDPAAPALTPASASAPEATVASEAISEAPARGYTAVFAKYKPSIKYWYVVIVGRRVGVFSSP